ncbi:MAG TPA: PilZ domain-containing protein, partial [Nitrospiria bacterium]|nr:PilZ domain-containing protein [Nitrospiria bacterium]
YRKLNRTAEENRKDSRIPYVRPVSYAVIGQFLHASCEVDLQGIILDISGGGFRIRTDVQPDLEEMMIRAWIPLPQSPFTISVIAEVRWVRDEMQNVYDIGFRFLL